MSKPNPTAEKIRLDLLMVKRGLVPSREKAQALILAGQVLSGDRLLDKPGLRVSEDMDLRLRGKVDHYVSRGAHKLLGALNTFPISLQGTVALDIGASTGGFTQVCLERGATKVYALDVGHNQLDWLLRSDPRVVSLEGVNIRSVPPGLIPETVDFVCIDASFISLQLVLPHAKVFLKPTGQLVALIKPQHEVGRENVGKGGIVADPALHTQVKADISSFAQSHGFVVSGLIESPITGTTGNREFLIWLKL